jgi:redox-sensitive bicupin YhaK (pirin superfamily)
MIELRKAEDRGHADHGWLNTYHTFAFASYRDPKHMGFRSLRVMNEDRVAPGRGFGTHAHDNMEIVSYVLEGALEHKDSMGNGAVLRPGEFQRISAGTGITHSEANPSSTEPVHFYQIWLFPAERGIEPSYEQKRFDDKELTNAFRLVASPDGADGSLSINQDARIYLAKMNGSETVPFVIPPRRHVWLQVLRGSIRVGETEMATSDGAAISDESKLEITPTPEAELMLFDLA